jgi:C4-dicarboxylate-specific signal transduction histidine kinase
MRSNTWLSIAIGSLLVIFVLSFIAAGAFGYTAYRRARAEQDAQMAERHRQVAEKETQLERKRLEMEVKAKKVRALLALLASAQDEPTRARLQAELAEAQRDLDATGGGSPRASCGCVVGDPLCECQ